MYCLSSFQYQISTHLLCEPLNLCSPKSLGLIFVFILLLSAAYDEHTTQILVTSVCKQTVSKLHMFRVSKIRNGQKHLCQLAGFLSS